MPEPNSKGRWREPLWSFVVHIVVGAALFSVIAAVAVALDFVVRYLSNLGVSPAVIIGLKVTEHSLFSADLILLLVFIVRTSLRVVGSL